MADLHLGDLVVSKRVMQYDIGMDAGEGRLELTAYPKIPLPRLLSAATALRAMYERDASSARVTTLLRTKLPTHTRPSLPDRLFQASYEYPFRATTCDGLLPHQQAERSTRPWHCRTCAVSHHPENTTSHPMHVFRAAQRRVVCATLHIPFRFREIVCFRLSWR